METVLSRSVEVRNSYVKKSVLVACRLVLEISTKEGWVYGKEVQKRLWGEDALEEEEVLEVLSVNGFSGLTVKGIKKGLSSTANDVRTKEVTDVHDVEGGPCMSCTYEEKAMA